MAEAPVTTGDKSKRGEGPLPLALHGSVKGSLTVLGNTSAVFAVGEKLQAQLKVTGVKAGIDSITVGLHQSLKIRRNMEGYIGNDEADKSYKVSKQAFKPCFTIEIKNFEKTPSEKDPVILPITIEIPEKALPTVNRSNFSIKSGTAADKEIELACEIECSLVVAVIKTEKTAPKAIAAANVTLIATKLPPHLKEVAKSEWRREMKTIDSTILLKCLTPNPVIGKPIEFELNVDPNTVTVRWVKLYQRFVCLEHKAERKLDPAGLKQEAEWASVHSSILRKYEIPDILKSKDRPEGYKPAWYIDNSAHTEFLLTEEDQKKPSLKFTLTIPADPEYQGSFSTRSLYNMWIIAIKFNHHKSTFGPIPIVWSDDADRNILVKQQERCSLL